MSNFFKSYFEQVCKIQKRWLNINVSFKKDSQSSAYQISSIGPFAYFSLQNTNKYDFILFMPDFSPINSNENIIILQPNIQDVNLLHTLTFSNSNDAGSFLKCWYDSLILVEDMLRAIVLRKYPNSEKILMYNKSAKIFQETFCVIQAISSIVVFQTQFFNGAVMNPGISIDITKDFISGIVTPLNTIVPPNKRLFSFYISGKKKNDKLYFVCPNKESLMQWVLILHGLSCQAKYTDKAIDEQNRYESLMEKITKMINEIDPPNKDQIQETSEMHSNENKEKENIRIDQKENNPEINEIPCKEDKINDNNSIDENNDINNINENNDINDNDNNNNNIQINIEDSPEIKSKDEEEFVEEEEPDEQENQIQIQISENNEETTAKNNTTDNIINNSNINNSTQNDDSDQNKNISSVDSDTPVRIPHLVGVESILPDSIDFSANNDEKPQIFDSEEFNDNSSSKQRKKKAGSILDHPKNSNKNENEFEFESTTPTADDTIMSSSLDNKNASKISPNAYDENIDYYCSIWFKKKPQESQKSTSNSNSSVVVANSNQESIEKQIRSQVQQHTKHRSQRYNSASSSLISSSYISSSSCISTDDEPLDISDDESQGGALSELGIRVLDLVNKKDTTGVIAEAIAATSDEKPISEFEFNQIVKELKKIEKNKIEKGEFILPKVDRQKVNFHKEKVENLLENSMKLYRKSGMDDNKLFLSGSQFQLFVEIPFDKIVSSSIEKIEVKDKVSFDFFDFEKLPSICSDFDPSLLNAYTTPCSPYFTELMIEINNILKVDIKKSITNDIGRKFTYLLSALFLNGLRNKDHFYLAIKELEESFTLISPIIQTIRESELPHYQSLNFVIQILERNFLLLIFREIQRNDKWIKKFYLPSSLMLYGSQLTEIVEELSKLNGYEFRLSNGSPDLTSPETSQNLPLIQNSSNPFASAVNAVISSSNVSLTTASSENVKEFENIVDKYANVPTFQFVLIDNCEGSPDETVKLFIELLEEGQNLKSSLLSSEEKNAWKFITEVADVDNDKNMIDFDVFKKKWQDCKGTSFLEANRNVGLKLWSFLMEGFKLKKLHVWFLILACNKNIASKFYAQDSSFIDMFRIRHVVSKLEMLMKK